MSDRVDFDGLFLAMLPPDDGEASFWLLEELRQELNNSLVGLSLNRRSRNAHGVFAGSEFYNFVLPGIGFGFNGDSGHVHNCEKDPGFFA